jgi:hypothetical protein
MDALGAAVQADVKLSVAYAASIRSPDGALNALDEQVHIAPGQTHYYSLEGAPILAVKLTPCAWDEALGAFECDLALAEESTLELLAQKGEGTAPLVPWLCTMRYSHQEMDGYEQLSDCPSSPSGCV